jgi:hypothetical protein
MARILVGLDRLLLGVSLPSRRHHHFGLGSSLAGRSIMTWGLYQPDELTLNIMKLVFGVYLACAIEFVIMIPFMDWRNRDGWRLGKKRTKAEL